MIDTPRTDALLESILERRGNVGPSNCPEDWVLLARKLERELIEAKSLTQQLRDAGYELEKELENARYRLKTLGPGTCDLPGTQALKKWSKLTM